MKRLSLKKKYCSTTENDYFSHLLNYSFPLSKYSTTKRHSRTMNEKRCRVENARSLITGIKR